MENIQRQVMTSFSILPGATRPSIKRISIATGISHRSPHRPPPPHFRPHVSRVRLSSLPPVLVSHTNLSPPFLVLFFRKALKSTVPGRSLVMKSQLSRMRQDLGERPNFYANPAATAEKELRSKLHIAIFV